MTQRFRYTKDDGSTSDRVLHAVTKPGNVSALDLSALIPDDQVKAARLYDEWIETHDKPYKKLEREYRKANCKSLADFFSENGLPADLTIKSFKPQGLVPADQE